MKTSERFNHPSRSLIVGVAALGLTLAVVSPPPAFAGRGNDIVVPEVPRNLQVEAGHNSPNPEEAGRERPTWQDSRDSSAVWGNNSFPPAQSSTDSRFVRDGAIPWLLLPVAGTQVGPTGGDRLTKTTFIQRLDTVGGVAPDASTCATPDDAGHKALRPYSADYFFYRSAE
jgi:Protein of unknown function (DUF3455)